MSLTAQHILTACRAAGAGSSLVMPAEDIALAFNEAISKYGEGQFTTVESVAALVSECMMESAYFRTTEEYAKNGRYAPFIGRTFIQITWKANYAAFGAWCKGKGLVSDASYFVDRPARLAETKWAAIGGVWYFTQVMFHGKPLTAYSGNIAQVGKAVNLGNPFSTSVPNGQRAREAAYVAVRALGPSILPTPPAVTPKGFDMAAAKNIYLRNATDQPLKGQSQVYIDDKASVSVVSGVNDGVDVTAGLVLGSATQAVRAWWRLASVKEGTPVVVHHDRLPVVITGSGQVSYKGSIGKAADAGRNLRLRLIVEPVGTAPVVLSDVQITGWKM